MKSELRVVEPSQQSLQLLTGPPGSWRHRGPRTALLGPPPDTALFPEALFLPLPGFPSKQNPEPQTGPLPQAARLPRTASA